VNRHKVIILILKIRMKPIIISIDGNIASGKSTCLAKLKEKYPNIHFIDEPVDTWTQFVNEDEETLLQVYYKDRKRWSYTFQNVAFLTRVRAITKAIKDWEKSCKENPENLKHNIFITERSVDTDFNVFAKMLHEDKSINKMEWDIYRQWYRYLSPECRIAGIMYINCTAEKCKDRIGVRGRTGEDVIPLDYLQQLHKYHEDWIGNTSIPILRINTQEDTPVDVFPKTSTGEEGLVAFDKFISSLD
jgi:deoxyadenosine/deoxycytidine kinase